MDYYFMEHVPVLSFGKKMIASDVPKKSVLWYDTGRMLLDVPELLLLIVRIVP